MQTVVETPAYLADSKRAGMTEAEREAVVEMIANRPQAGDEISGTGGARKVRVAGRGKGKSGGYRVITFYSGKEAPVSPNRILEGRKGEPEQGGEERIEKRPGRYRPRIQGAKTTCLRSEGD